MFYRRRIYEYRVTSSQKSSYIMIDLFSKCFADMCILSNNIYDYVNVSQGKITIPNVDDGEECLLTDVSPWQMDSWIHRFFSFLYVPLCTTFYISACTSIFLFVSNLEQTVTNSNE